MPRRKKTEEIPPKAEEKKKEDSVASRVVLEAEAADKKAVAAKKKVKKEDKEKTKEQPPALQEDTKENEDTKEKQINMDVFVNSVIKQVSYLTKSVTELKEDGVIMKDILKNNSGSLEEKQIMAQFSAKLESLSREIRNELSQFSGVVVPKINQLEREIALLKTYSSRPISTPQPPVIKSKPPQPPRN